jgi:hypothetical protein
MGYALGWVAIQSGSAEAILERLGFSPTGVREALPNSAAVGAALPGSYLVVVQRGDHLVGNALLKDLSIGTALTACFVEEHVMYSTSVGWEDGRKIWSVVHDSEKGSGHLAVDGVAPSALAPIRARLESAQRADAEADFIFDIPIDLAKALTGFRHDEALPATEQAPFEVLAARRSASRPWWKRVMSQ